MKNVKYFVPLFLFFLVMFSLHRGLHLNPREIRSPFIDKSAPAFSGHLLQHPHEKITQTIFLKQVSMFNVFASWCPSCAAEHSVLMNFHRDYPAVQMVGLCFKDNSADALQFLKKLGNPYSFIINDESGNIGIDFGVYGTPETFVIDQRGVIRDKISGPISPEVLQDQLIPLVKQLQAAPR